ncbi:aminotransferase class V-fold PLP-dependent enzyme [Psychrobacillus lasiicapitis]|uniref:Aminotransferase class V-fold PLP-dependent enzyme n=1 Tax=Psychrobacillus lasiicapitis TaxID=1636719 RepID=A0A544T5G5_9BACI|nr:aminotransferase class V-fold PLP-dependent enzyme [Psychrobacillus lasiicapitis]TQR12656.1 aminotransferase class V-fold PLP-dependent enzyme [Psychrobacillus lasiicapitis]GGA39880.1 acetyltransferase [Psychrobacillus lasiicapitis]
MYWCKIARTEKEFEAIARLNYQTFVEEIPQHEPDPSGMRIDPFHHENVYVIVLKDQELAGMVAFRAVRPFSLDLKLGPVEDLLPEDALNGLLCEVRLMAVDKAHRNGRVFYYLARALSDYAYENGYGAAVISGTIREQKLYNQLGFEPFAETVGTGDALFVPMVLTRERFDRSVAARFKQKRYSFYPGPVQPTELIQQAFLEKPISHRSHAFEVMLERVKNELLKMSEAKYVHLLAGSGTLANEAMIAQLYVLGEKGLILTNGAFGERLEKQASRWGLAFEVQAYEWGTSFDRMEIEKELATGNYSWLLMTHGETSTGMLNDIEAFANICKKYNVLLCADCVSSFGALPFSMAGVYLATGVSGKALGTMSGLAFVFSNSEIVTSDNIPAYLDIGLTASQTTPFTMSSQLVQSLENALKAYEKGVRYTLLQNRMKFIEEEVKKQQILLLANDHYPMIITWQEKVFPHLAEDARMSGFDLHYKSDYLVERGLLQVSCIQPDFEDAWSKFTNWLDNYRAYHTK